MLIWRNNLVRGFAYAALAAFFMPSAWAELPNPIRILNYSIHHGEGLDGKTDLPRIAKIISEQKPDIVSLQQVDEKTARAGGVDQAAELGRLTAMKSMFSRAIDQGGGSGFGNAVLTNLPV